MSAFITLGLWGQNVKTYDPSGPHLATSLLMTQLSPDEIPYDGSKREDGIDGSTFQNIGTIWQLNGVIYPYTIDQSSWDDGDYHQTIRCFRSKHLWIVSMVTSAGWENTTTDDDGTDHHLWSTNPLDGDIILPKKVTVTWGPSEMKIGVRQWRKLAVTFRAEKPDVGVIII